MQASNKLNTVLLSDKGDDYNSSEIFPDVRIILLEYISNNLHWKKRSFIDHSDFCVSKPEDKYDLSV